MRKIQTFWRESMLYCEKVYYCRKVYLLLRKGLLTPKSIPIIAKRFNYAEKYIFIAKRFNYAELYQAYGHYTIYNVRT